MNKVDVIPLPEDVQSELEIQVGFLDSLPDNRITIQRVKEILWSAEVPPDHKVREMLRAIPEDQIFTHEGLCKFFASAGIPLNIEVRADGAPPRGHLVEEFPELKNVTPEQPDPQPHISNRTPDAYDAPLDDNEGASSFTQTPQLPQIPNQSPSVQMADQDQARPPKMNGAQSEVVEGTLAGAFLASLFGRNRSRSQHAANPAQSPFAQTLATVEAQSSDEMPSSGEMPSIGEMLSIDDESSALGKLVGANISAMQKLRKEIAPYVQQITSGRSSRGSALSSEAKDVMVENVKPLLTEYTQRMGEILDCHNTGILSEEDFQSVASEVKAAKGFREKLSEQTDNPHIAKLHEMTEAFAKMIMLAIDALLGRSARNSTPSISP